MPQRQGLELEVEVGEVMMMLKAVACLCPHARGVPQGHDVVSVTRRGHWWATSLAPPWV